MRPDSLTDLIRRDILDGRFEPGDRLREATLAIRYECGRDAVRLALVELDADGLVERETNRGATVRRTTLADAIQIMEARAALESLIAAEATRHASALDRDELRRTIEEMSDAVSDGRRRHSSELNSRFHQQLREMSRHTIAAELVANLRDRAVQHQYRLSAVTDRPAEALREHHSIAEAVIAGDAEAAALAMTKHLQAVADVLASWGDGRMAS